MELTIHRGSDEIGGSWVELMSGKGDRILLDAGMPLARKDGSDWPRGTMKRSSGELRAEGVLPDINGLYAGERPTFSALILSHAHLDHHGLAHYVHPDVPVYASRGTIEMLNISHLFVPDAELPANLYELPKGPTSIGDFKILGIPVDHGAPDSRAILVEGDGERVLYSGDLRAHGRQSHLFGELPTSAGRVDVLILEGTTIGQPTGSHGLQTELDVEVVLRDLAVNAPGIVVVIAAGQNVDRAISVYRAALAVGRNFVMDSYQAYVHTRLRDICPDAPQSDWEGVRVKFVHSHVESLDRAGLLPLAHAMSRNGRVSTAELAQNPAKYVYLSRASGATVALLRNLRTEVHPTVVWSQWKGYLKKGGAMKKFCDEHGMEIIPIHAGGHAHPHALQNLVSRLAPKVVVPIHTEAAKKFKDYFPNVKEVGDGETVNIASLCGTG